MTVLSRAACQTSIDYRDFPSTMLPFVITLDQDASILQPETGALQRFCYRITGEGLSGGVYPELQYILLGVAAGITRSDISELTVTVNQVIQRVTWGVNAQLITAAAPDAGTGCTGLKLLFPLSAVASEMTVCLTLARPFGVGPMPVCLYGGGEAATGLSICGPALENGASCPAVAYQEVDVCVPVTVTPYATVGDVRVRCCGAPMVSAGAASCAGTEGGTCSFTVSQRVCVAVSVAFGARAQTGAYRVNCGETGSGSCPSCEDTPSLTEESPPCGCQAAIRALSALPVAAETLSVEKPGQPILRRGACPGLRFG